jgi:septum formation protein
MTDNGTPIVLASASPRRRDLFRRLRIAAEFTDAGIDERAIPHRTPREYAIKAAYAKASAVAAGRSRGIVIGMDTIVVLDGLIYGKPDDAAHARAMLAEIAGRTHTVISGVAVVEVGKSSLLDAVETDVTIRPLTGDEIADYVGTGEPLDKAGSYALQGIGRGIVARIDGDYFNVVGLPVSRLLDMMDGFVDTSGFRANLPCLRGAYGADEWDGPGRAAG